MSSLQKLELVVELPCGVTGFWRAEETPPPSSDLREFQRHCHAAALTAGGRVMAIEDPAVATNFSRALLELASGRVSVLLNANFPFVAFAEPLAENSTALRFIDVPDLAAAFRGFEVYHVLDTSDLLSPLTPERCKSLSAAELKQIKYWQPRCVGDVLFNFWD